MSTLGQSALAGLSTEALREVVREVLRDVLPAGLAAPSSGGLPGTTSETVALHSDADLAAFVRRVAALCEDPAQRAALRDGRTGFRLAGPPGGRAAPGGTTGGGVPPQGSPGVVRVERGAVTERMVARAAAEGARLHLGRGAVLTPLARDKARRLGVAVDKDGQDPGRGR